MGDVYARPSEAPLATRWPPRLKRRCPCQAEIGQLLPFGVASEISRERPFARAYRSGEASMVVDAWWRDESGEAVEQFQARQQQRSVPARTGLGALVEQTLGIEFAQPVQGKPRAGAIAQQPLTPRAVVGSWRTDASTEKPPPCSHFAIASASSAGSGHAARRGAASAGAPAPGLRRWRWHRAR
jgi:hypothetical protein